MRVGLPACGLLVVLSICAASASAETTLFFVGDGSTTVGTDPDSNDFTIAPDGAGDASVWYTVGWPTADTYDYANTAFFVYDGSAGALTVVGEDPLELHVWVEKPTDLECGVFAQIFSAAGDILGPEGGVAPVTFPGPGSSVTELVFPLPLPPGKYDAFGVQVIQSFIDCGSTTMGIHWGGDTPSGLVLGADDYVGEPEEGQGALPDVVYEDLPEGDAVVEGEVDEPTTGTFIFNWTTDLESVLLEYAAEVVEGSVRLSVIDGAGEELMSADVTATVELNETLDATPGDWQFVVEFDAFLGYFGFTATAAPTAPGPTAVPDGPATDGPATETNTTVDDPAANVQQAVDVDDEAESPGAGLLFLVAALGVALLLRRR